MKKTTSSKLTKKLASYGALTAAIVGVTDAQGQAIVYTDITDFTGGAGDEYLLDLDNNGTNDFRIHANSSSSANLYLQPLTASNEALGSGGGSFAYPFALSNGAAVSASASGGWYNNSYSGGYMSLNYGAGAYGNFYNVTDKYIGLRFNISGNTHYGWIRLDVGQSGTSWTVKDFAYMNSPGLGIAAGQQALSTDAFGMNTISIVANKQNITLYNLPNQTNYNLFSLTGKLVLQGTANSGNTYTIESNSLASGVYIVQLTDTTTNATISKKITL